MKCVHCKIELEAYFTDYEVKIVSDERSQTYFKEQNINPIAWTEQTGRIIKFYFCPCCGFVDDEKVNVQRIVK